MTSSRSWSEAILHSAMIYRSRCKPGDLLKHQFDNCPSTSIAGTHVCCNSNQSQFNRCNGSPFIKTQRICHRRHTSPTRYLNKLSTTTNNNNNSLFTAFPASKSTG